MDNGWEVLNDEQEKEYQKQAEVTYKIIKLFLFVVFPLLLVLGLYFQ